MADLAPQDDAAPAFDPEALTLDSADTFDPEEAAKMLGLTPKQFKFAEAMRRGASKTRAAKAAGYRGTDEQLRSAGSAASRSEKVRAYLAWADKVGAGQSVEPCDTKELKKLLSRHARGEDKNASIAAIRALNTILEQEDAERAEGVIDPNVFLDKIAALAPPATLIAMILAHKFCTGWKPRPEHWAGLSPELTRFAMEMVNGLPSANPDAAHAQAMAAFVNGRAKPEPEIEAGRIG